MPEALGIYREERFSPGKVADDRAIIDLAAAELGRAGVAVRMAPGESLPSLDRPPALVFAMCQSPAALEWMDEAAKRAIVVNHPSAIRACYRANLLARLDEAGVPQPPWAVAGKEPPTELGGGVLVEARRRARHGGRRRSTRLLGRRMGRRHRRVPRQADPWRDRATARRGGGVQVLWSRRRILSRLRPSRGQESAARALARRAAAALGLEVYGGDGVSRRRNARADRRQRLAELLPLPRARRAPRSAAACSSSSTCRDAHESQTESAIRPRA